MFEDAHLHVEVPTDEQIEAAPEAQEYTLEDIEKWKEGADAYRKFASKTGIHDSPVQKYEGELQALFLKEKPAIFAFRGTADMIESLKTFGFKAQGDFIYDVEQVQSVIDSHTEFFTQYGSTDADEVMEKLAKEKNSSAVVCRGIVLGFPVASALGYERIDKYKVSDIAYKLFEVLKDDPEKQDYLELNFFSGSRQGNKPLFDFMSQLIQTHPFELGVTQEEIPTLISELRDLIYSKRISIYGNNWVDYGDNQESEVRQQRLRTAFEQSGILNR